MICKKCGNELEKGDQYCLSCGEPVVVDENVHVQSSQSPNYTAPFNPPQKNESAPLGLTSFILGIISMFLPLPYIDMAIGAIAIVFAIFAFSKENKRGFAIAGLTIGIIAILGAIGLLMENGYDDFFPQVALLLT